MAPKLSSDETNQLTADALMDQEQVAALLRVSRRTLEFWRATRQGPDFIRCGRRRVRYKRGDLDAWVETHRVSAESAAFEPR